MYVCKCFPILFFIFILSSEYNNHLFNFIEIYYKIFAFFYCHYFSSSFVIINTTLYLFRDNLISRSMI